FVIGLLTRVRVEMRFVVYLNHPADVQAYMQQQRTAIADIWESIEAQSDYQQFRQRLLLIN
ncbi:MAG: hypothetical protein KDE47_34380, partial [Caldilineaceae bacterium]|nr:hypothetical protein [Caldilineaceae bacterium]